MGYQLHWHFTPFLREGEICNLSKFHKSSIDGKRVHDKSDLNLRDPFYNQIE